MTNMTIVSGFPSNDILLTVVNVFTSYLAIIHKTTLQVFSGSVSGEHNSQLNFPVVVHSTVIILFVLTIQSFPINAVQELCHTCNRVAYCYT